MQAGTGKTQTAVGIINSREDIDIVGQKLKEQYKLDTVLITRSEEGMTLYDEGIHNIPTYAKEVYDVTGAGDTVISVFTLAKSCRSNLGRSSKDSQCSWRNSSWKNWYFYC